LALAAGEVWKITGASRRSAAPGSQSVGVAEYGDDLGRSADGKFSDDSPNSHQSPRSYPWSSHARLRAIAREKPHSTLSTLVAASKRKAAKLCAFARTQPQRFRLRYPCANPASPQHQQRSVTPEDLLLNPQNATTQRNGG
jgi:hypothetical protein